MRTVLFLWKLIQPMKKTVILAVGLGAATILSGIGLMATSAYLISLAGLNVNIGLLQIPIVGVRFFGISRGVFRYFERLVSHTVSLQTLTQLRVRLFIALERTSPRYFRRLRSGNLLRTFIGELENLQDFFVRVLAPPAIALVIFAAMFLFLACIHLQIALLFGGIYVMSAILVPLLGQRIQVLNGKRIIESQSLLQMMTLDVVDGGSEIIAFGQQQSFLDKFARENIRLAELERQQSWTVGLQQGISTWAAALAGWAVLLMAIPLVYTGVIDGVLLATLVLTSQSAFEALRPLSEISEYTAPVFRAAEQLSALQSEAEGRPVEKLSFPSQSELEVYFDQVEFAYEDEADWKLSKLSFGMKPGSKTAVVGPSGSGKSTLINLLLGFWKPTSGKILFNGQSISEFDPASIRDLIAVIPQDTWLFNASVSENLRLAKTDASALEIAEAGRKAQIHSFSGETFDFQVGGQGAKLSAGQRRRLAIARAFLRPAPLLMVDEATSNLDIELEREIITTLLENTRHQTLLLITHRFVGLEQMDQILVMHDGRIIEQGTWDELLAIRGDFYSMWKASDEIRFRDSA
jgi:ATP-binding cassette, subfamily C, bacterial CydC